jgi:hypothetical protein
LSVVHAAQLEQLILENSFASVTPVARRQHRSESLARCRLASISLEGETESLQISQMISLAYNACAYGCYISILMSLKIFVGTGNARQQTVCGCAAKTHKFMTPKVLTMPFSTSSLTINPENIHMYRVAVEQNARLVVGLYYSRNVIRICHCPKYHPPQCHYLH